MFNRCKGCCLRRCRRGGQGDTRTGGTAIEDSNPSPSGDVVPQYLRMSEIRRAQRNRFSHYLSGGIIDDDGSTTEGGRLEEVVVDVHEPENPSGGSGIDVDDETKRNLIDAADKELKSEEEKPFLKREQNRKSDEISHFFNRGQTENLNVISLCGSSPSVNVSNT